MKGTLASSFVAADGKKVNFAGKSGKSLDYALVEFEQTKVQEYINQYVSKNTKENFDAVMKEVNASFKYAEEDVKAVMKEYFTDSTGNSTFDFSNYSHRVTLGQKIIDRLHDTKQNEK